MEQVKLKTDLNAFADVQIQQVVIRHSTSKMNIRQGPLPTSSQVGFDVHVQTQTPHDLILVLPTFRFVSRYDDSPTETPVFVQVAFQLVYRGAGSFSDEQLEDFAFFIGVRDAWPYFQEFVRDMLGRMGLPLAAIPPYSPDGVNIGERETTAEGNDKKPASSSRKAKATRAAKGRKKTKKRTKTQPKKTSKGNKKSKSSDRKSTR